MNSLEVDNRDVLSTDIEYFINLFVIIDGIIALNPLDELKQRLMSFLPKMKAKSPEIKKESIYYFQRALGECVYKQSSLILRYILITYFDVKYDALPDSLIERSPIQDKDPKPFLSAFSEDNKNPDLTDFDVLFQENLEKKTFGNFFDEFVTKYEFNKELSKKVLNDLCDKRNILTKLDRLLLMFPEYLEIITKTFDDLLFDKGNNMKQYEKYYLAIMGAASVNCEFLIKDLIKNFLLNCGDENWIIQGLNGAPEELRNFCKIFNVLAYQPWKLKLNHLLELDIQRNLERFIQACIITTSFQRLGSIIESIKIKILKPEEITKLICNHSGNECETPSEKEKASRCVNKIYSELKKSDNSKEIRERKIQLLYLNAMKESTPETLASNPKIESQYNKFKFEYCTKYEDFDLHLQNFIFSTDFSFENVGYYTLIDYWKEPMKDFAEDFDYIFNLTSNCFSFHKTVEDMEYFRRAIVTYVEKIYGLCDETFDYSRTNKVIKKELKAQIKYITCFPERVNFSDTKRSEYSTQDLIHVVLLSSVTKQRAQLTYLAKLINELQLKHQ